MRNDDLKAIINEAFSEPNLGLTDDEVNDLLSVDIFERIKQKKAQELQAEREKRGKNNV